ncbi:HAD-IG family 5'-nucleotidase [bacterium]|nr:HAD-IG family 5'-nucleotidase [bacterium]
MQKNSVPLVSLSINEQEIENAKRVFVARNLKMESVQAIGFDLDHTLAIYNLAPFDELCYSIAKQKLVETKNFPKEILKLKYDPNFLVRGLVVDTLNGNILKANQYGYVSKAAHGSNKLSRPIRKNTYSNVIVSLGNSRFQSVDTLFALPEISLFSQVVDFLETKKEAKKINYFELYQTIREVVDLSHKDGSIKKEVISSLEKYFIFDQKLSSTLSKFRSAGKKLFILTNSEWFYTNAVMSYILSNRNSSYKNWTDFFDVVVCSSKKPNFFGSGSQLSEFETEFSGKFFTGGKAEDLEKILGLKGEQILYFGDHTYGDIMRSKKDFGWRTAMIIYELEHEIIINEKIKDKQLKLLNLRVKHNKVDSEAKKMNKRIASLTTQKVNDYQKMGTEELLAIDKSIEKLLRDFGKKETEITKILIQIRDLEAEIEADYNVNWGPIFKSGNVNSRFGDQVQNFACVYTSRVSNFFDYEDEKYFRSPMELMPHEL